MGEKKGVVKVEEEGRRKEVVVLDTLYINYSLICYT